MLSIITPTYNRANTLKRLYDSLLLQNNKNFEWIIIDDGSSDNTKEFVSIWKYSSDFPVKFYRQENSGKHRALNKAFSLIEGEFFLCVDSDDYLPSYAVDRAIEVWKNIRNQDFIGIIALRGTSDGALTQTGKKVNSCTLYDFYFKYGWKGDTALFYKTNIVKNKFFKTFEGEKFISENSLYFELDKCGQMYLLDEVLYYNEYQENGLTANYSKLLSNNPKGTAYMYWVYSNATQFIFLSLKYSIAFYYYYYITCKCTELKSYKPKYNIIGRILGKLCYWIKRRILNE